MRSTEKKISTMTGVLPDGSASVKTPFVVDAVKVPTLLNLVIWWRVSYDIILPLCEQKSIGNEDNRS